MRGFELAVDTDLTLVLAEARFAEPLAKLVDENREHLARFDPWAVELAEIRAARAQLESGMHGFAAGTAVPALMFTGGTLAGVLGLHIDVHTRSATVGYWLGAAYTGRGLATRALRALSRFAFEEFALIRVSAQLEVANARSRAVVERAGFRCEGVLRSAAIVHGAVVGDLELWSLLPADLPSPAPAVAPAG